VIERGCENSERSHPNCGDVLFAATGTIAHYVKDGVVFEMEPGDAITIPIGLLHRVENMGSEDAASLWRGEVLPSFEG